MKTIIVTGDSGFIGTKVKKKLKNYNIIGVSRSRGIDITNPRNLDALPKVEGVIHLAGQIYGKTFTEYFWNNVIGTRNMLEICRRKKIPRFVYISTILVYDLEAKTPWKTSSPLRPESDYSRTKLGGEELCRLNSRHTPIIITVLRLGFVYGKEKGIPREFIREMKEKNQLEVYRNPVRDYVFVEDVADAIVQSLDLEESLTLNIGTGRGTSLMDIASLVAKKYPGKVIETWKGKKYPKFIMDISETKKYLDYNPRSMAKGIDDCE